MKVIMNDGTNFTTSTWMKTIVVINIPKKVTLYLKSDISKNENSDKIWNQ